MSVTLLLLCGSLRAGSVNEAVLRTAQAVAPHGVRTPLYEGMDRLPHFNPDDDGADLDPEVATLRAAIGEADVVLICTPEYAGALPGSFKNLLDWTVGGAEMRGDIGADGTISDPQARAAIERAVVALAATTA